MGTAIVLATVSWSAKPTTDRIRGPVPPFSKVLVANRGEIAIRVFRALRELEIASVGVYSEADRDGLHPSVADEAYLIGPGPAAESYLVQERLLETAARAGAEAVHPGYGFLAENASFARAVEAAGLVWIGPPPEAIEAMGSKTAARELMRDAGVPIVPGSVDPVESVDRLLRLGDELGWPLAVKAAAGGGGKGLKVARTPEEAERAFASARREGEAYFGDPTVYVERYVEDPRHVEVQVLADAHGHVVHLGERDCTIQRRHQKLVEETPSPAVSSELRERIGEIAVSAAEAVGYRGAGTIEGLLDRDGRYWFLEMNTRIQVEHPVTELVTGIDLVRHQILVAAGQPLPFRQENVRFNGHAIECRINAEDPGNGFLPAPGVISAYREPAGPGIRVDSGVREGSRISELYDPMIAKLCVWDVSREAARRRMLRALDEFVVEGPSTLIGFHKALLTHPCFVEGATCFGLVESEQMAERAKALAPQAAGRLPAGGGRSRAHAVEVEVDGRRFAVAVSRPEPPFLALARSRAARDRNGAGLDGGAAVVSPMQGTVLAVEVAVGDEVREGQVVCVVEAMKMENEIAAHRAGRVASLAVSPGEPVKSGQVICVVEELGGA
jgi:acetyl-CoA/propionyl-CoA carboxylase biotin carboxyl carrier protein